MTVPGNIDTLLLGGQKGYQISRSLRFNSADSAYLNRVFGTPTNNIKWTWSGWVKRSAFGSYQNLFCGDDGTSNNFLNFRIGDNNDRIDCFQLSSGSYNLQVVTDARFRDPSAWYHVVLIYDSANATSTDRIQIYVNGNRQTVSYAVGPFAQNTSCQANLNARSHAIGRVLFTSGNYLDGYLTEINFIDGQALTPSSFGETDTITGVWKPKKYAGTYGTNGFYLNFADNSGTTATTLGKDSSGNGNNWTPNNFSVTAGVGNDSMNDTPTPFADGGNNRGNYCTLNPLINTAGYMSYANGNLQASIGPYDKVAFGTFAVPSSGKWYWEWTLTTVGAASAIAVVTANVSQSSGTGFSGGTFRDSGANWAGTASNGDIAMVAVDMDSGKIWFGRNGTWNSSGNPATGANPAHSDLIGTQWFPMFYLNAANGYANFGNRQFNYTPPSGFLTLCTQNLPEPTLVKGSSYMDAKLYTGNGGTQTISGLGFSPDLVWIKGRSVAYNHQLQDTIRGAGKELQSDLTGAETSYGLVSAFNSDGFTVYTNGTYVASNNNGTTYVAWCWDAGSSTVTNTSGTISSQVRANASAGFSVVTYTGTGANATVGHGLGVAPRMFIVKERGNVNGWYVYHASLGASSVIYLDSTSAAVSNSVWNNTQPSSTAISIWSGVEVNRNGGNYVAYCFSAVAGYSAFGSYTGNGSSDGPFVFTGFRPRFILFKNTTNYNWQILDTARADYNQGTVTLFPNLSNAENTTATQYDVLSNGFKIRTSDAGSNGSGNSIIFAAFAENPFKYSLAR